MSQTVQIRPLTIDDATVMAGVLSAPSLYEFTGGEPPSAAQLTNHHARQIAGTSPDGSEEWINQVVVLEPDGRPIGYVQATIPSDGGPTEIAWVIGEPWQGRGHATAAARLLVELLARRGVTDLVAHIHPDHGASQAVARHLGMAQTAVVADGEVRWQTRHR